MGAKDSKKDKKKYVFDIDGIIATITPNRQYDLAGPIQETIDAINYLYDEGHEIVLFTARGSSTGIDWTEVTQKQMSEWGVKHHKLILGKPDADYYIDDKFIPVEQVYDMVEEKKRQTHSE